jgi:hypothetical protein
MFNSEPRVDFYPTLDVPSVNEVEESIRHEKELENSKNKRGGGGSQTWKLRN